MRAQAHMSTRPLPEHIRAKITRICNRAETRPDVGLSPEAVRSKLLKAGVPVDIAPTLALPLDTEAMRAAGEFLRDKSKRFLLLLGSKGVGKTTAAVSVMQAAVREFPWNELPSGSGVMREPCRFVTGARFTALSGFTESDREFFEDCQRLSLLVLDDVGDEATQFGTDRLCELLKERFNTGRRTVLTSNLQQDGFKARYGEFIADRIRATGVVKALRGPSMRKAGAP